MIEDKVALQYWRIFGYGSCQTTHSDEYVFGKYERAGYIGYCISQMSPFESRRIKRWGKEHGKSADFYWSKSYVSECWNQVVGCYNESSRCVWVTRHLANDFASYIDSLPRRSVLIPILNSVDPMVKKIVRGLNYKIIEGIKDDPDRTHNLVLSVQDFPRIDQLRVMAAISS